MNPIMRISRDPDSDAVIMIRKMFSKLNSKKLTINRYLTSTY